MCRHVAWVGEERTLADVILTGRGALLEQAYAPRLQRHGRVNADGFGAGWYHPSRPEPARYRRAQPIWTDASFASLAGVVASGCLLAAVRSATAGMPIEESATAPFSAGPWLFSHNGRLDYPHRVRARMGWAQAGSVESSADSALVWALLLDRLSRGADLATAMADVVADVLAVTAARLNLLATDGRQVVATRVGDTLHLRQEAAGVSVASEPHGGGPWQEVPEATLVVATRTGVDIRPLPVATPRR